MKPIMYIFGGLPASGKSSLATHLAKLIRAAYIRVDSIEEAILSHGELAGPEGYVAAYAIAADNLQNGVTVIADSVNPIELTRSDWIRVAQGCGVPYREIHIRCSDRAEHRRRLEQRTRENPSLRTLQWDDVNSREFEPWRSAEVFDTAGETLEESKSRFERAMGWAGRCFPS
jgi:predicted kinase